MSGRTFEMTESEDDCGATDGDDNEQDLPNDDGFDENETEPAPVQPVKKKRAVYQQCQARGSYVRCSQDVCKALCQ